jgi:hypothetical protein
MRFTSLNLGGLRRVFRFGKLLAIKFMKKPEEE